MIKKREQQQKTCIHTQYIGRTINLFIPQNKCISPKNQQSSVNILLDQRIKQHFKNCIDNPIKKIRQQKIEKNMQFLSQRHQSDKIFNPKILQHLLIKEISKQQKYEHAKISSRTQKININYNQTPFIKNRIPKYQTSHKFIGKYTQRQKLIKSERSKTLQNNQNFNICQGDIQNFQHIKLIDSSLDVQKVSEKANNYIAKLQMKKPNKKKMVNSSYMFLNHRNKFNFDNFQKQVMQKIELPISSEKGTVFKVNELKRHLILKSNSNNKLIKRNKSYSKQKQIFSFLNLTPQNHKSTVNLTPQNHKSTDQDFKQFINIQNQEIGGQGSHSSFNRCSHKKLVGCQFYTKKQKSTHKLHSYKKQKLKIVQQNKKKNQLNRFHNTKMLEQLKNPLSSLGQLVKQILSLTNDNYIQVPKQLGINKVRLTDQQEKMSIIPYKGNETKISIKKKFKKKVKINQINEVQPWEQLTQNNFFQTSKFFNQQSQNSIF